MIESLYLVPRWFYHFDIVLGIIFAIIAAIVATNSFKIYNLTKQREFQLFGISFICISISYLIRIGINTFLSSVLNKPLDILEINGISQLSTFTVNLYAFLFILGYATWAYTTLRLNSKRAYFLITVPSLLAFYLSYDKSLTIYLIIVVLLLPILYHYLSLYTKTKEKRRSSMVVAVSLLLASNFIFMFIADYLFYQGYIISAVLELVAYGIIGISLYNIKKYGEKKK